MARKRKFSNCGPVDVMAGYLQLYASLLEAAKGDVVPVQCYRDINFGASTENIFVSKHQRLNIWKLGV